MLANINNLAQSALYANGLSIREVGNFIVVMKRRASSLLEPQRGMQEWPTSIWRRRPSSIVNNRQYVGVLKLLGAHTAASAFSLAAFSSASRLARSSLFLRRFSTEELAVSTIFPTAALPELMSALLTSFRALGSIPDIVGWSDGCNFVVAKLYEFG
jgi:hypothetical protein